MLDFWACLLLADQFFVCLRPAARVDWNALSRLHPPDFRLNVSFPAALPEQQGGQNGWTPWHLAPGGKHCKAHVGSHFGVLAQLVERLNGIEEVRGSIPLGSR